MTTGELVAAAVGLYRALNLMPCACARHCSKGGQWIRTKVCVRCKALEQYQELYGRESCAPTSEEA